VTTLVALLVATACSAPATQAPARQAEGNSSTGGAASRAAAEAPAQRKAITIALRTDVNALAGDAEMSGGLAPASLYVQEFLNAYLTVRDQEDEPRPQLARELPSLDTGSWKLMDNGRMEVTWKLRDDVKWHDGTPVTAGDVQFGWEVVGDRASAIGARARGTIGLIESVETPDATTVVMHWKSPSPYGGELGLRELPVFPRHLLAGPFQENKEAFHQHEYFTNPHSFVGAGPYRPVEWERDSHLAVEAVDGYFLGRPKIARVLFRFIQDSRTALANVLAGAVEISYLAVEFSEAITVRDQWSKSGDGTVWLQPNQLRMIQPQMRSEYARPADLATSREVRRALFYGMDRQSIAEAANPGAAMVVDADGVPGTRFGDAIRSKAVHYDYEPARAQSLLDGAGWRRGSDGFLEKGGQRFELELFANRGAEQDGVFSVMRENYRQLGIDLSFAEVPRDAEKRSTNPGLRHRGAFTNEPRTVQGFDSSRISTADTRWAGSNYSGIDVPALDRVLDAMERSVRFEERAANLAEVWRILTDEAVTVGLYIRPVPYLVKKGMKGPIPTSLSGSVTSNVQSWEAP
jgi:peptide/nickel transport system substrate-binding protein